MISSAVILSRCSLVRSAWAGTLPRLPSTTPTAVTTPAAFQKARRSNRSFPSLNGECSIDAPRCSFTSREHTAPNSKRLLRADVGGADVLVAEAFDLVPSFFLIETDLGRSHDLTRALTRRIKLYLKITKRVVGGASAAIELDKRHVASGNDGDDRV